VERLRLGCIEETRRARRSSDPYCSDRFGYGPGGSGGMRDDPGRLVGPGRVEPEPPELLSQCAYEVAFTSLSELLPACTHSPGAHPVP
jgi:hypothetical protein